MTRHSKIIFDLPEKGLKKIEGFSSIEDGAVHLFIPIKFDVPSQIKHIDCKLADSGRTCQFLNVRLSKPGNDFDDYIVEEAYVGENKTSFTKNEYKNVVFSLSNDIAAFFDEPWTMNDFLNTKRRTFVFKTKKARTAIIKVSPNIKLTIRIGYSPSLSKTIYDLRSTHQFEFEFVKPLGRTEIFNLVNAVVDFYSLFCLKRLTIAGVDFTPLTKPISYIGKQIKPPVEMRYSINLLAEYRDLKDKIEKPLTGWINDYVKNKIPLDLVYDSQQVPDEQLKFICLSRCLEIYHKENIINSDKAPEIYFSDLYKFLSGKKLISISEKQFKGRVFTDGCVLTLSHCIYDLIRSVHNIIDNKKFRFLFSDVNQLDRAQKISDTRNYYIHFSPAKKIKAWKIEELRYVNYQLSAFIRVLFLRQIDLNDFAIEYIVRKMQNYLLF